jgi:hypothetical protein
MVTSGIFEIRNTVTGRAFIGYGKDVEKSKSWNINRLWRGLHLNRALQADFDLYGGYKFAVTTLAVCKPSELVACRRKYQDQPGVYNPIAYKVPAKERSRKPRLHLSEKHKGNISFAMTGIKKKPHSESVKRRISASLVRFYADKAAREAPSNSRIADIMKEI